MQGDVRQFFPSVDHAILRAEIARRIEDPGVLWLVDGILNGGRGILDEEYTMVWFPGDDLLAACRPRGLPIGNLTSQFWANCYLSPFDHFVKRELRCPAYVRYVDDFLLFGDDKREMAHWRDALVERLERFRLTIHPGAHPRPVGEGIHFLGFVVFPERRRLKRRNGIWFRRRLTAMLGALGPDGEGAAKVNSRVRSWVNHVRYGNTVGLRKAVFRTAARAAAGARVAHAGI